MAERIQRAQRAMILNQSSKNVDQSYDVITRNIQSVKKIKNLGIAQSVEIEKNQQIAQSNFNHSQANTSPKRSQIDLYQGTSKQK